MTAALVHRPWVPEIPEQRVRTVADAAATSTPAAVLAELDRLVAENQQIHEVDTVNLNPATNVMNPRAEAMLSAGLGSRPSLGYPGDKYEMGLEAIEQIEIIAAELVAEVFGADYAEVRVPRARSPTCTRSWPPAHRARRSSRRPPRSAATSPTTPRDRPGRFRLHTVPAPIAPAGYTVDVDALRSAGPRGPTEADHDRGQPQPLPAPGGHDPGDSR